ncbi:kinase-like protein [Mytilinidion resinicola]|uniref:non-specific serine/threonine protein kinase n=1 Tax=Mytilinidion resinicola TaxID=574789 RepID=A0A6A6YGK7_9PEZI|nr:kinase-like protein [Mytilinidion resinicola]KAF2807946.1 kinase-like protein [Mytilinidion resinicola]
MASMVSSGSALQEVWHEVYAASNPPPLSHIRELGRGGFSIVDAVQVTGGLHSGRVMARKVVRLPRLPSKHRSLLRSVLEEVQILNRLKHIHVITVAFTYEELDAKSRAIAFGILMPTVAEQSLAEFLEDQESDLQDYRDRQMEMEAAQLLQKARKRLGKWYLCLAQALAYLHQERVRHRDIKPANILIKDDAVFLTDFGLSKYFEDQLTTMTYGVTEKTQMYCAPEVAASEHRGRPSDIWSLGCVFLEMTTIYAGASLSEFASTRGPVGQRAYHLHPETTLRWVRMLQNIQPRISETSISWCLFMLNPVASKRITAMSLADLTLSPTSIGSSDFISPNCSCTRSEKPSSKVGAQKAAIRHLDIYLSTTELYTWDDLRSFEEYQQQAAKGTPQTSGDDQPNPEPAFKAISIADFSLDVLETVDATSLSRPAQDRLAQAKKAAAEGVAELAAGQEVPRRQTQSQDNPANDGESSGEETIESRVARIKARVAELTGNVGGEERR